MTDILNLAPYACHAAVSRGRRYTEPAAPTRSDYQRDRDRIVHSSSFRRLVYKTQVFLNHEGDLFRTRLTHSLEVAQLARSIGRSLRLNEDLLEAIALAHDLGHTPFGHAGQDALNACMQSHGGFEHNLQSLRVVDSLEVRYPDFTGLNLTFETREGILKHCSAVNASALEAKEPGGVGARFLNREQPSLEAQLANLADEIAYNAHDIDDGVRSGLLSLEQLEEVALFSDFRKCALSERPGLAQPANTRRLLYDTIRRMLSEQVYDVIGATKAALERTQPSDVTDVRQAGQALVRFSDSMRVQSQELKRFLFANLYRHPQVVQTNDSARRVVRELFGAYLQEPDTMKPAFAARAQELTARPRVVADFIAGMTDRYAAAEHERLTGTRLLV